MIDNTQIKIKNSSTWRGKDRWSWSLWIEGESQYLDEIDRVEYVLHPTFPEPVRVVRDRASSFQLESKGWGEFMVHAKVITKQGQTIGLNHWLKLSDREKRGPTRGIAPEKPTVFVSFSKADYPLAASVQRLLEGRGIEVLSENQLGSDEPTKSAIASLIGKADAVLALIAEDPSSWVLHEISEAQKQQIPVMPMLLGKDASLPDSIAESQAFRIDDPGNVQQVEAILENELAKVSL
jgi:hypothetical protein